MREPEVHDHHARVIAFGDDHHVVALEIAVDDPLRVRGVEPGGHLFDDQQGLVGREPPLAGQARAQGLAREQLHREERHREGRILTVAVEPDIEDAADVAMGHPPGDLDLGLEPGDAASSIAIRDAIVLRATVSDSTRSNAS